MGDGTKFTASGRTFKMLSLFLLVPIPIVIFWCFIPLIHPVTYSIVVFIFWSFSFFAWLSFYDFLWPNCSPKLLIATGIAFTALSIATFAGLWVSDNYDQKISFSIIFLVESVCTAVCYTIHFVRTRKRIIDANGYTLNFENFTGERKLILPDDLDLNSHWTSVFYNKLCFIKGMDDVIAEEVAAAREAEIQKQRQRSPTNSPIDLNTIEITSQPPPVPPRASNPFEDEPESPPPLPPRRATQSPVDIPIDYHLLETKNKLKVWAWSTFALALLFKFVMIITWFFLQAFVAIVGPTGFKGSAALAVVVILFFQVVRLVLSNAVMALNGKLPGHLELAYFAQFAVQMLFSFYYRNLFVSYKGWATTIVLSVVTLVLNILVYPVYMTKRGYSLRFEKIGNLLECILPKPLAKLIVPAVKASPGYDRWIKDLTVEYYYDKLSGYYSLFTFVLFLALIRYVFFLL